jgi:hypothetical protein
VRTEILQEAEDELEESILSNHVETTFLETV